MLVKDGTVSMQGSNCPIMQKSQMQKIWVRSTFTINEASLFGGDHPERTKMIAHLEL